jgi:Domain of unknown function (DUF4424)
MTPCSGSTLAHGVITSPTKGTSPHAQSGHLLFNYGRWLSSRYFACIRSKQSGSDQRSKGAGQAQQSSLVAMQIGSAPNLEAVGIDINVAVNAIAYSYFLKNTGSTELDLTATVSLPELRASDDGSETWVLASNDPENPVGFSVTATGTPVTTKAEVHVYALGLGRLAEIKAEHLPLIPFGPEVDKALASISTEAADRLAALGIISSRNPAQPKAPATHLAGRARRVSINLPRPFALRRL